MDRLASALSSVTVVDAIAAATVLAGALAGWLLGLGRAVGWLVYLVAALWCAGAAAPTVLGWMPNTARPDDLRALSLTYAGLVGVAIAVPLIARVLAWRRDGRKRHDRGEHRLLAALAGGCAGVLLFTLAAPYAHRLDGYARARAPALAARLADSLSALYPECHRRSLNEVVAAPDAPPP